MSKLLKKFFFSLADRSVCLCICTVFVRCVSEMCVHQYGKCVIIILLPSVLLSVCGVIR